MKRVLFAAVLLGVGGAGYFFNRGFIPGDTSPSATQPTPTANPFAMANTISPTPAEVTEPPDIEPGDQYAQAGDIVLTIPIPKALCARVVRWNAAILPMIERQAFEPNEMANLVKELGFLAMVALTDKAGQTQIEVKAGDPEWDKNSTFWVNDSGMSYYGLAWFSSFRDQIEEIARDEFVEVDLTAIGNEIQRWSIPYEARPVAIEGNNLVFKGELSMHQACGAVSRTSRGLSNLSILYVIAPDGSFTVRPDTLELGTAPHWIEEDGRECLKNEKVFPGSAYRECGDIVEPSTKKRRRFIWQAAMT